VVGRVDLGLSTEEFWQLTPREFDALVLRREDRITRQYDLPAAVVAQTIAELWRSKESNPEPYPLSQFVVADMMRRAIAAAAAEAQPEKTADQILFDKMRAVNFHLGGSEDLPERITWLG